MVIKMVLVPESPLTGGFDVFIVVCILIMSSAGIATAQATTDPTEATALNTILARWGVKAPDSTWNISGEPCSGWAIDDSKDLENFNPGIKCDCTYNSDKTCHIVKLRLSALDIVGTLPDELQNLKYLNYFYVDENYLTGPVPAFIGNLTQLTVLSFNINALSGPIPKELSRLKNLNYLGMGINNFNGSIPEEFGNMTSLQTWWTDSSGLSGELPETLSKLTNMQTLWANDNDFTGKIPEYIGTNWTSMIELRFHGNSFRGPIPPSLSNLVKLNSLRIGDITHGSSSTLGFISNMTSLNTLILRNCKISDTLPTDFSKYQNLQLLDLSFNNITGEVPESLFSLSSLIYLFLGNNSLSGSLPSWKSLSLLNIDLSYNLLSGSYPSWASQNGNIQLNLVANNFDVHSSNSSNSSVLPSDLRCLQRDFSCHKGSPIYYSFAINCGGAWSWRAKDGTMYQSDNETPSAASYYVSDAMQWGVSNVGVFVDASSNSYVIGSSSQFHNTLDSELFQNARMSPSSLRYYGFGLENGNYTVKLQFAETAYPNMPPPSWKSTGRRIFDIFIQGVLKEKDFDIRQNAGGNSFVVVVRNYVVPVTNNFIEIHFFWAGKGTFCVPTQGYYGPAISAISVSPFDFKPKRGRSKEKVELIAGVVVGVTILVLVLAVLYWRWKKKTSKINEELLGIVDRSYVFSYAELRTATKAFNICNILGEGGYGPVYKGTLSDGRIVAVKQLAVTSNQGKREFLTEISTISTVQHKNLVKLYGCCFEGNNRLLVYEFLENGSLDQALFGKHNLHLDWVTRFDICLGIAKGLTYLHEESSVKIIHRDIKASNILLDCNLNPKISDFGLAKLYESNKTHISTGVAGTLGYLAPEYAMKGHLTEKTDVFAFGVVALEVVAGRSKSDPTLEPEQIYLLEWAWSLYEQNRALELLDPKLTSSYNKDQALRLISVSLLCIQASQQRPSMSRVVAMLTGDVEVGKVTKPNYVTDWLFKEITDSNFSTRESSDLLMDSIIQEGR